MRLITVVAGSVSDNERFLSTQRLLNMGLDFMQLKNTLMQTKNTLLQGFGVEDLIKLALELRKIYQ